MSKFSSLSILLAVLFVAGCHHVRFVAASDTRDYGESVRTRFRYQLICDKKKDPFAADPFNVQKLESYHLDVFDSEGIPVKLVTKCTLSEYSGGWTVIFPSVSFGIVPSAQTLHEHHRATLFSAGRRIASFDVCVYRDESMSVPTPLPVFVFAGEGSTCFPSGRKFLLHCYGQSFGDMKGIDAKAMAYGIAACLKEAEDSGQIGEQFATMARSAQSLQDAAAMRAKIVADNNVRHGGTASAWASSGAGQPFEIVRCDNEQGKDFAYTFTLRRRGGGAATLSDYGVMRNAFRSAIRTHYASSHPEVNARTLVVDFTDYALKGGVVSGRVAVLSIAAESLSYDSARRKGVVRVRIGVGQFEDARRWIRRNLAALANRNNVVVVGDAIPKSARFYSEHEEMREGVLEVSFRTE